MATTLPQMTETIDTEFMTTWYEIRPQAIDNILDATVVSALLKEKGCFKSQVGGRLITRSVRYGEKTAYTFGRGDTLPVEEPELETMAWWPWAYFTVPVTRSLIDDQQNNGPSKIKDYVMIRLNAAREALVQKIEDMIMAENLHPSLGGTTLTDTKAPFSLFDYVPNNSSTQYFNSSYTWGNISRANTWWQNHDWTYDISAASGFYHDVKAGPVAVTIEDDMDNCFNTIKANLEAPDIILTSQTIYELFSSYARSKDQLIKSTGGRVVDLGYDILNFRGKVLTWTPALTGNQMLMLNSNHIEIIYDPNLWFDMSEWRTPERSMDRVAYISSTMQLIGAQPRRHGRILWAS